MSRKCPYKEIVPFVHSTMFNGESRKNYVWSWLMTSFEDSEEWIWYSEMFIVRILLNRYIISGPQNPQPNPPSQDPRWRQGSLNLLRIDNASGSTSTSHPSFLTGIASLPSRPATVANDSNPRYVAATAAFIAVQYSQHLYTTRISSWARVQQQLMSLG